MSKGILSRKEFYYIFKEIKKPISRYKETKVKFFPKTENKMYWEIGKTIASIDFENVYKKAFFRKLSTKLQGQFPKIKYLSVSGLANCHNIYKSFHGLKNEHPSLQILREIVNVYASQVSNSELLQWFTVPEQKEISKLFPDQEELEFCLRLYEYTDNSMFLTKVTTDKAFFLYKKIIEEKKGTAKKINEVLDVLNLEQDFTFPDLQKEYFDFVSLTSKEKQKIKKLFHKYDQKREQHDFDIIQKIIWDTLCLNKNINYPESLSANLIQKKRKCWEKIGLWQEIWHYLELNIVKVRESSIDNKGVFAKKDIPKDAYIIQYKGPHIPKAQLDDYADIKPDFYKYLFLLNDKFSIDGDTEENRAKYINHSCAPNCYASGNLKEVWIIARRKIYSGEEITFDYGYQYKDEMRPCYCQAKNCVGYIVTKEDWHLVTKTI